LGVCVVVFKHSAQTCRGLGPSQSKC